jgi:peptidoglycan hydrolase CwlO-like protein
MRILTYLNKLPLAERILSALIVTGIIFLANGYFNLQNNQIILQENSKQIIARLDDLKNNINNIRATLSNHSHQISSMQDKIHSNLQKMENLDKRIIVLEINN